MLKKRVIPGLLLRKDRLVKGARFSGHRDAGRPNTTARAHDAQGADEITILDIDASREKRAPDLSTLKTVACECFMPLTFGGGINTEAIAAQAMDSGADKLCLTTTALDDPSLIGRLARIYGSQAIVLGVDVVGDVRRARLFDHRSAEPVVGRGVFEWIREGIERGAGEIRLVAVDREGTRKGMDLNFIAAVLDQVSVPVVAEGGAGVLDHLAEALHAGLDGVAVGTMLVFSDNNIVKIKRFLANHGCDVRI